MEKKRNAGIDLLRILCMGGVSLIHAVGYGLGLHPLADGDYVISNYSYLHICLLALSTISVNVFFLMSGYFHTKFRISKLIELLVEGSLYASIGYLLACVLGYKNLSFLPLCRRILCGWTYWFLTAYIVIYCFSDYITKLLDSLSDNELKKLLVVYGSLNTILGFMLESGTYGSAFSVVPMLFVYVLGYSIKRLNYSITIKGKSLNIFVYFSMTVTIAVIGGGLLFLGKQQLAYKMLTDYRSPLLIISACGIFMFFLRDVKLYSLKGVSKIAIHVFAVYLLTDGGDVHDFIWKPLGIAANNGVKSIVLLLYILVYIVVIMIICIIIDMLRKFIYMKTEKWIIGCINKYIPKND